MRETLFEPLAVGLNNLLYNLIVASVGYFYLHLDLLLVCISVTSIFDLIWFACLGGTCGNLMAYDAKTYMRWMPFAFVYILFLCLILNVEMPRPDPVEMLLLFC